MTMLLVVLVFFCLAAAVFALSAAFISPAWAMGNRLQTLLGRRVVPQEKPHLQERIEQVLEPLSDALPKSSTEVSETQLWLMQAGYRDPKYLKIYFGLRALSAIVLLAVVLLTGLFARSPLLLLIAPALGYMLPRFLLKRRISKRQIALQLALPDALDLAIICVEAGLGLDQALERAATELRHAHPQLSEELGLVNLEMRAGKGRAEALRNLASRTGADDIRSFVAVLIQTERFGTSIANSLRVHSDALRTERRQRAEERAAKTTIKMVPVLVLFIFPVMFIAILAPAVISAIRNVMPVVNK